MDESEDEYLPNNNSESESEDEYLKNMSHVTNHWLIDFYDWRDLNLMESIDLLLLLLPHMKPDKKER
ncbi:hypothetical protein MKW92_030816, partial [Papaver armeniacum]